MTSASADRGDEAQPPARTATKPAKKAGSAAGTNSLLPRPRGDRITRASYPSRRVTYNLPVRPVVGRREAGLGPGIRPVALLLAAFAPALPSALGVAGAAEVRVLAADGAPVADVTVLCWAGAKFADLTGPDGRVQVPDGCVEVRCEMPHGDVLPVQVPVREGGAVCRMQRGAIVIAALAPRDAARQVHALLFRDDGTAGASALFSGDRAEEGATQKRLGPVAPGRYTLDVLEWEQPGWACARDLGELAAGETRVELLYREPMTVTGRIVTSSGRPARGEIVRARPAPVLPGADDGAAWRCSTERWDREPLTAGDGSFTLRVDPGAWPITLEVGHPQDEEGTTTLVLDGPPTGPLTILRRPTPYEKAHVGRPAPK